MYWPRLALTPDELKRWAPYAEPGKTQRAVIYRAYGAELRLNTSTVEDSEQVQISRRSRIFAMTASGDVHNFEIEMADSAGERYTMGFIPMSNFLLGSNADPRSCLNFNRDIVPQYNPNDSTSFPELGRGFATNSFIGPAGCVTPHIFEPNILLAPNQTITLKGRALNPPQSLFSYDGSPVDPPRSEQFWLSITLHVWEFPPE